MRTSIQSAFDDVSGVLRNLTEITKLLVERDKQQEARIKALQSRIERLERKQ